VRKTPQSLYSPHRGLSQSGTTTGSRTSYPSDSRSLLVGPRKALAHPGLLILTCLLGLLTIPIFRVG
jgi:hypothetical protein